MAVTLSDARTRVRRKLEDTTGTPLWADALLDDGLRAALDEYSSYRPAQTVATVTLAEGATTFAVPADCLSLLRVMGPDGWLYPPATDGYGRTSDLMPMWEVFGGAGYFTAGVGASDYTLWYTAALAFPANDAATFPTPDSDVGLLVALAVVYALAERTVQEWKRGGLPARYETALRDARAAVAEEWRARRRRVRVGTLVG